MRWRAKSCILGNFKILRRTITDANDLPPSGSLQNTLVSVICPTTDRRHVFHPLLYECFCRQVYEPKELVVIDTGSEPSVFLEAKAREDKRIVYRFFPNVVNSEDPQRVDVADFEDGRPLGALIGNRANEEAQRKILYEQISLTDLDIRIYIYVCIFT